MKFESKQAIFDTAVRGLASQGFKRSVSEGDTASGEGATCLYNGPGGIHCAVGWLIVDLPMHADENDDKLSMMIRRRPDVASRFNGLFETDYERNDFLAELQRCHDIGRVQLCGEEPEGTTPDAIQAALRRFAERHGLSASVLD